MASAQWYVYSEDTGRGVQYFTSMNPSLSTTGVRVGGPFPSQAAANAFISSGAAGKGLGNAVNKQQQQFIGKWIVVPEGEGGKIVNALSQVGDAARSAATLNIIGAAKSVQQNAAAYTVAQLTNITQVNNAEQNGLELYDT